MKTGDHSMCESSDAYASVCVSDEQTDRPILAEISVCSKILQYPNRRQKEIFLHEIAHTLGLTPHSYAFLRYRDGTPRTPRNKSTDVPALGRNGKGVFIPAITTGLEKEIVLQTASKSIQKTVFHFTLPTLLEVARRVFNASNLAAFPMEDLKIEGLEGSHFDGRTALGELMTAPIGIPIKITHFLLAFMYDTGWYDVSGAHATVPTWGLLAGEEFVTKSCYEFVKLQQQRNKPPSPFCGWPEYKIPACLPDRSGYGLCDISPIKALAYHAHSVDRPRMNQMLKQYNFGGRYVQLNHCPIITEKRKEELWYRFGHVCTQEINIDSASSQNFAMEEFGSNSICLDHDRQDPWRIQTKSGFSDLKRLGASCHRHRCVRGSGLEVIIGNSTYNCPPEGGSIKINVEALSGRLLGSVHCPICETVCQKENCQVANPEDKKAVKTTPVQEEKSTATNLVTTKAQNIGNDQP
ncbi:Leishmanolysin-like peptidase [Clonorchis sinensis]|uniref:Leishmanolysin-like peptidase n=1 Tax=Clonorchis sinensis TaxID=79923 RepID=A0A8T1MQR5_CLOSI|nr:Leishmanolysin-like peptidase [Clonorchis sinensis]